MNIFREVQSTLDGERLSENAPPTAQRSGRLLFVLPPLVAFLLARSLLTLVGSLIGWNPNNPKSWLWHDAVHYLSIGFEGYFLLLPGRIIRGHILGNIWSDCAWFPGYPYLIRELSPSIEWSPAIALLISGAFALGTLYLLWYLLKPQWDGKGFLVLVAAAIFPCFLFMHAISPVSVLLFISLLFMMAMARRCFVMATALAVVASFTYSTGFVLTGVAGLWLLLDREVPWKTKVLITACMGLFCIYTVELVFWIQNTQCHTEGAFFQAQAGFDNQGLSNPLTTLWRYTHRIMIRPGLIAQVPMMAGVLAIAIAAGFRNRKTWEPMDKLILVYCAVIFLFPLSVGTHPAPWAYGVQPWRPMALMTPLALLLRRSPRWLIAGVLMVEVILAAAALVRFAEGKLV